MLSVLGVAGKGDSRTTAGLLCSFTELKIPARRWSSHSRPVQHVFPWSRMIQHVGVVLSLSRTACSVLLTGLPIWEHLAITYCFLRHINR